MKLRDALATVGEYGVGWALWRGAYAVALRSGYFRRVLPGGGDPVDELKRLLGAPAGGGAAPLAAAWSDWRGASFLPTGAAARTLPAAMRAAAIARADAVLAGEFRHFGATRQSGFPPAWFAGEDGLPPWPAAGHWSRVADLGSRSGDIKQIWELSRFGCGFDLGRAYLCSGDERYAEGFWTLCEDWWAANPAEEGPHWRCGQEASFRILAWCFALHALQDAAASTPERVGTMIAHLRQHGRHVEKVNWYAVRCVRNNHAISEAVALRSLGLLFPFLPEADRWRRRGGRGLARELAWQIRPDGTYIQNSNNYARLVVQLATWALRLEGVSGSSRTAVDRLQHRAGLLLDHLQEQLVGAAGELPNFGPNDGTLLFPWSDCSYRDFRPALHALARTLGRQGLPGTGPWREEAFWFGLPLDPDPAAGEPSRPPRTPSLKSFPDGGLHVLRGAANLALFRCGPNTDRPAEADMLHVDYWYGGQNVLLDPGTFRYNADNRLRDYFAGTRGHNTVTVDGRDQMRRGSRFLWHGWVQGIVADRIDREDTVTVAGHHRGYRPVRHRREVHLKGDCLLVVDEVGRAAQESVIRLHWLLADLPREDPPTGLGLVLPTGERIAGRVWCDRPVAADLVRDRRDEPRGVWSPCYGVLAPAWSWAVTARADAARFVSCFGPPDALDRLGAAADPPAAVVAAWQAAEPSDLEYGAS